MVNITAQNIRLKFISPLRIYCLPEKKGDSRLTTFTTHSTTTSPQCTTSKHANQPKSPIKNHVSPSKTFLRPKTRILVETCTHTWQRKNYA
jgi:hypothetical protein